MYPSEQTESLFSLNELLEGVVETFGSQVNAKGLDIWILMSHKCPKLIRTHQAVLAQLLTTSIHHALRLTHNGEVLILVSPDYETDKSMGLRFNISDTGSGLESELLQRIESLAASRQISQTLFEEQQADSPMMADMAQCLSLVQQVNGSYGVQSAQGRGTTYWFEVPVATALPEAIAEEPLVADVILLATRSVRRMAYGRLLDGQVSSFRSTQLVEQVREWVDQCDQPVVILDMNENDLVNQYLLTELVHEVPVIQAQAFEEKRSHHSKGAKVRGNGGASESLWPMPLSRPVTQTRLLEAIERALQSFDGKSARPSSNLQNLW